MKLFVKKLGFYIICYLIIASVIRFFVPYHWGNPQYSSKILFLNDQENSFNAYFFGSSRVHNQINPQLFDSIVNSSTASKQLKSFNLGAPATFTPQTYYLFENFLESDLAKNARYCFLELGDVAGIANDLMHQERANYWINTKYLYISTRMFLEDSQKNISSKFYNISKYFISYIQNMFHFGHFGEALTKDDYYNSSYLGPNGRGFNPLDEQLENTTQPNIKNGLIKRRTDFLNNEGQFKARNEAIAGHFNKLQPVDSDSYHLSILNKLMSKADDKGIELIFIISPRNLSQGLLDLSASLPPKRLMNLANPAQYPEFYSVNHSFDIGHFDTEGAGLYSIQLAKRFIELKN